MTERSDSSPRTVTIRLSLTPEVAAALQRRASRNDRLPFEEAQRILRRSMAREVAAAEGRAER